jgi:hypothetical protein
MRRIRVRRLRGILVTAFAALGTIVGTAGPAAAYQTTPGSGRSMGTPTSTVIDPNATVIYVDLAWIATAMSLVLLSAAVFFLVIRHRRRTESTSLA